MSPAERSSAWLYVGTQRSGPGTGLSRARFDASDGTLSPFVLAAETSDPGFFAIHPDGRHLVTCNSGTPGGESAFALTPATGALAFANFIQAAGRGPSQLGFDRRGRFVLAANYGGGFIDVLPFSTDGRLGAPTGHAQHTGRGPDAIRQTQAYVHCVTVDPTNRFALVADLGLDRVYVYRFDAETGVIVPHDPPFVSLAPASGPRHFAWHPNGRTLYLIQEMSNTITVFGWDGRAGRLEARQTIPTLPADFHGENTAAEILVHPNGRVVYASNRGHDSVARFAVDPGSDALTAVEHVASRGRTPRYMAFDPTHRWLAVSNVDSDTIALFEIVDAGGALRVDAAHAIARPYGLAFARVDA